MDYERVRQRGTRQRKTLALLVTGVLITGTVILIIWLARPDLLGLQRGFCVQKAGDGDTVICSPDSGEASSITFSATEVEKLKKAGVQQLDFDSVDERFVDPKTSFFLRFDEASTPGSFEEGCKLILGTLEGEKKRFSVCQHLGRYYLVYAADGKISATETLAPNPTTTVVYPRTLTGGICDISC